VQTAVRAKQAGTLAKPACPLSGIASDALAARPEGDIASDVSCCEGEMLGRPVGEPLGLMAGDDDRASGVPAGELVE
jgi:hypothetical protein